MTAKRKRPSTAAELSEEDEEDDMYDDDGKSPQWKVTYPKEPKQKSSKREKYSWDRARVHASPFHAKNTEEDALDLRYVVEPKQDWESMRSYNKFVIADEDYSKADFVFVRPPELKRTSKAQEREFWVARILEVRAIDAQHVYALCAWLYWPEQLRRAHVGREAPENGRRAYHGKHELMASNHLDVCDVTSFAGHAPVEQWLEEDDNDVQTGLYWRQIYDIRSGNLSELREHCSCKKYYNPDATMLACPNTNCRTWLHSECIMDAVLTQTYNSMQKAEGKKIPRMSGGKAHEVNVGKSRQRYSKRLEGKMVDECSKIEITDLKTKEVTTEPIKCLCCGAVFD